MFIKAIFANFLLFIKQVNPYFYWLKAGLCGSIRTASPEQMSKVKRTTTDVERKQTLP
jgi:hypothetical protein